MSIAHERTAGTPSSFAWRARSSAPATAPGSSTRSPCTPYASASRTKSGWASKSVAIVFFENEDDYKVGDATLDAMPTDDTPGSRTSVTKYDVACTLAAALAYLVTQQ